MVTAAAAMVLSQKLGFTVKLEEGRTSQQVYQALADGELHMAFEVWPESNLATFKQFTQKRSVEHVPYATLFGRSGIFESCSRSGSAADSCTENKDTNPILRDFLDSEAGVKHYATVKDIFGEQHPNVAVFTPSVCKERNCTVEIFHIAELGYDEGKVEELVELLGIPAKVVYLGEINHTEAIWQAYAQRRGGLFYSYYPNANQNGVSVLELPRAKIAPGLDFDAQQLAKLAWPGLQSLDVRGQDAWQFIKGFELEQKDYVELGRLHDLFDDPQRAACEWLGSNRAAWEKLVRFPERKRQPLMCALPANEKGFCTSSYIIGWALFFLQLITGLALCVYARFGLKYVLPNAKEDRRLLEQAMKGGGGGGGGGGGKFVLYWEWQ